MRLLLDSATLPVAEYTVAKTSRPSSGPTARLPTSEEWKTLAANGFKDYRLKVYGSVENPVELSLDELRAMAMKTQITLHHCIQGWSGIAEWGGLPMAELMKLVRPKPDVKAVIFYSFGDGPGGRSVLRQPHDPERAASADTARLRDEL